MIEWLNPCVFPLPNVVFMSWILPLTPIESLHDYLDLIPLFLGFSRAGELCQTRTCRHVRLCPFEPVDMLKVSGHNMSTPCFTPYTACRHVTLGRVFSLANGRPTTTFSNRSLNLVLTRFPRTCRHVGLRLVEPVDCFIVSTSCFMLCITCRHLKDVDCFFHALHNISNGLSLFDSNFFRFFSSTKLELRYWLVLKV